MKPKTTLPHQWRFIGTTGNGFFINLNSNSTTNLLPATAARQFFRLIKR